MQWITGSGWEDWKKERGVVKGKWKIEGRVKDLKEKCEFPLTAVAIFQPDAKAVAHDKEESGWSFQQFIQS